jgi:hypothetical protein
VTSPNATLEKGYYQAFVADSGALVISVARFLDRSSLMPDFDLILV